MTEKVNPSPFRPAEAFKTAGAVYYNSGEDNYVVRQSDTTTIATQDDGIDETTFTAFDIVTSPSSLEITIEPGEAFIFGSWLAKDTDTTITLSASSTETIFVGWDKDASNEVIIGPDDGRFATTSGNTDQKIPLWDLTTDGSGVTSTTDRRAYGTFETSGGFIGEDTLEPDERLLIGSDEYMVVGGSYTLNGDATIDGDLITVSNSPSHDTLSNIDPTDHLEVVSSYQITLSSGSTPAFDADLTNAFDEETSAFDVTVAPTTGIDDTYAFNFDVGRKWNNGSWDVPTTINWDTDPGQDLDVTVRIHRRT